MSGQPEPAQRIETWSVKVGRRIRARRIECGLSQTALGEKLGVTFQQIQKYEKGTNGVSSGRLGQISDILGVPITFFYDSDGLVKTGKTGLTESALFDLMQRHDTQRVAKAFNQLSNRDLRRALVALIEKFAGIKPVSLKKKQRRRNDHG
jgi:transcriptional regulator with XRE-family HTH domain